MKVQIPAHGHCDICDQVVRLGDRVCSPECQEKVDEAQRYKKRQMWILVAIVAGTLLLFNLMRMGVF